MSKAINTVFEISEQFMKNANHVTIQKGEIMPCLFYGEEIKKKSTSDNRKHEGQDLFSIVLYELMACAVNYQYWYGSSKVRPNGSCASKMYRLLDEVFSEYGGDYNMAHFMIDKFADKLIEERFPNVENRIKHLMELRNVTLGADCLLFNITYKIRHNNVSVDDIDVLIKYLPGFADDIFLKRAILFFMMLNRKHGWYDNCISEFPVPADYQVPNVLRKYGVIKYSTELQQMIDNEEPIIAGSKIECEIRSATILACKYIAEEFNCTMSEVDDFLWSKRDDCNTPFHLTETTWY